MKQVTVRTLDSRSQTFELDDEVAEDIFVSSFKEFIEGDVGIAANKQRLIFKGKVLQDPKKLASYGVYGNVLHLVERTPPSDNRQSSTTQQSATTTSHTTHTTHTTGADGSSNVYIGGVFGSGDVNEVTDRITQQIVDNILSRFGAGAQANVRTSSTSTGSTIDVEIGVHPSTTQQNSEGEAQKRLRQAHRFLKDADKVLKEGSAQSSPDPEDSAESSSPLEEEQPMEFSNTPESLATVLDQLLRFNREFTPMIERYRDILRESDQGTSSNDDHIPDGIAEIFHNVSHSLHALSDITVNLQSPQPRTLTCLPRLSPLDIPISMPFGPFPVSTSSSTAQSQSSAPTNSTSQTTFSPLVMSLGQMRPPTQQTPPSSSNPTNIPLSGSFGNAVPRATAGAAVVRPIGVPSISHTVVGIVPSMSTILPQPQPQPQTQPQPRTTAPERNVLPTGGVIVTQTLIATSSENSTASSSTTPTSPVISTTNTQMPMGPNVSASQMGQGFPRFFRSVRTSTPGTTQGGSNTTGVSTSSTSTPVSSVFTGSTSGIPNGTFINLGSGIPSSTSSSTSSTTSPLPFWSLPIPGMPSSSQHRDPLLPCQSFHFGPSFQQSLAGVNVTGGEPFTIPLGFMSTSASHMGPQQGTSTTPSQGQANTSRSAQSNATQSGSTGAQGTNQRSGNPSMQGQGTDPRFNLIMRSLFSGGMNLTIADLLTQLGGVDLDQEQDRILHLFLHTVVGQLSAMDVVGVLTGATLEPLNRIRPRLFEFVEKGFNNERPLTHSQVTTVTRNIEAELSGFINEIISKLEVTDSSVDLKETFHQMLRNFITELLRALLGDAESFARRVVEISQKYCSILYYVVDHVVKGGFEEFCKVCLNSETGMHENNPDGPRFRVAASIHVFPGIRTAAMERPLSLSEIKSHVIRRKCTTTDSVPSSSAEPMQVDPPVPSSSPKGAIAEEREPIDVTKVWAERNGSAINDASSDGEIDTVASLEEWNAHVPKDWIPIINRDVKRQRGAYSWHPPSDAYLSGLPPKKRKALKPFSDEDANVLGMLQESVAQAKVTPETSVSEIVKDCQRSNLQQSFHEQVQHDLRQRLSQDPDYRPKRYPNSEKHFKSGEGQGS